MPRTKVAKKAVELQENEEESNLRCVLEHLRAKKNEILTKIAGEKNTMLDAYYLFATTEDNISLPCKYLNMTIREIIDSQSLETTSSINYVSKADLLNITKSIKKERKTVKRSASFAEDDGYLTAESVTSGGRKSRSKTKVLQTSRTTRSLSRSNIQRASVALVTPANKKIEPNSYGVVTPKCKPNTPQILLRRPKNGEVALSMQGSPLFTASVVTENMANINIPLLDGRMLTLQPQRGLRVSQIPEFDPETLRQLRTLRENLSKVCEVSARKK